MKKWMKFAIAGGVGFFISFIIFVPKENYWHYSQWSAAWFQAIGSLAAVMVALFYPWIMQRVRLKNIKSVVSYELETNIKVVREISIRLEGAKPDASEFSILNLVERSVKDIDLRYWNKYEYEIANADLVTFERLRNINKYIEWIVNNNEKRVEIKHMQFISYAGKAVKNYENKYS